MARVPDSRPFCGTHAPADGIGWKSRQADLRRIPSLWVSSQIDGMYTLANLDQFRDDLKEGARPRGLLQRD